MGPLKYFLFVYVLGGVTFLPLLLLSLFLFAYYTFPDISKLPPKPPANDPAFLVRNGDLTEDEKESLIFKTGTDDLAEKFHRKHDSDVAAGYFAVCREYVPGGVNGKPPDKLSPAGEVVAQESPSVYQSMYRSIFDRSQKPTIEPNKDMNGKSVKKANNVFYVVLRHGHLMLYDDIQQLEVRYVISLEYHDVDLYGGEGEKLPEAEIYIKRNSIRFQRKKGQQVGDTPLSLPFFFFSESQSEKEDFYHAVLKNQEKNLKDPPIPLEFETRHIINLVQKLHSSEEQLQTRWLNALVGRWFLAIYKTQFMENLIRQKLTKKISRVKKPTFITRLALEKIDFGEGAPFITNPRLKDLTVNGDCTVEADVNYTGNARVEIAATARIDLGSRFKAREVDMVLAMTCKRIQGRMLLRIKPPPSNRLWFTFEKMPKVEMSLEPVVSSRQITYTVILKAIESRIMEVFAESIVLPFWDDTPFFDTSNEIFRGGIWKKEPSATTSTEIKDEVPDDEAEAGDDNTKLTLESLKKDDRNMSMPVLTDRRSSGAVKAAKKSVSSLKEVLHSSSSSDKIASHTSRADAPRVLRAPSFANVADPTLSPTHAGGNTPAWDIKAAQKRDSMLKDLSMRNLSTSPDATGATSLPSESAMATAMRNRTSSNTSKSSFDDAEAHLTQEPSNGSDTNTNVAGPDSDFSLLHPDTMQSSSTVESTTSRSSSRSRASTHDSNDQSRRSRDFTAAAKSLAQGDRKQAIASINAAATAAQKWGWGVIARNRQREGDGQSINEQGSISATSLPMGRGQPLPPPGTPLPSPVKPGLFSMPKRKPGNGPPPLPKRASENEIAAKAEAHKRSSGVPPTLPDRPERRRRQASLADANLDDGMDELLVVEAPTESTPVTPSHEHHDEFFGHGEEEVPQGEGKSVQPSVVVTKPPLPVRKTVLEQASLNAVTDGALDKAAKNHEIEDEY